MSLASDLAMAPDPAVTQMMPTHGRRPITSASAMPTSQNGNSHPGGRSQPDRWIGEPRYLRSRGVLTNQMTRRTIAVQNARDNRIPWTLSGP